MELSFAIQVLIIVSSGYVFATRSFVFKFKILRESGNRLYLSSATAGIALVVVSLILFELQEIIFSSIGLIIFTLSKEAYLISIFIFCFSLAFDSSWLTNKIPYLRSKMLAKVYKENDVDWLCYQAQLYGKPICINTDSRKVYIGYAAKGWEPEKEGEHLVITPLHSGYRDQDTLDFTVQTTYQVVYDNIGRLFDMGEDQGAELLNNKEASAIMALIQDYNIIIPRKNIVSISIFANFLHKKEEELSSKRVV